jgi:hypothetical protein
MAIERSIFKALATAANEPGSPEYCLAWGPA